MTVGYSLLTMAVAIGRMGGENGLTSRAPRSIALTDRSQGLSTQDRLRAEVYIDPS